MAVRNSEKVKIYGFLVFGLVAGTLIIFMGLDQVYFHWISRLRKLPPRMGYSLIAFGLVYIMVIAEGWMKKFRNLKAIDGDSSFSAIATNRLSFSQETKTADGKVVIAEYFYKKVFLYTHILYGLFGTYFGIDVLFVHHIFPATATDLRFFGWWAIIGSPLSILFLIYHNFMAPKSFIQISTEGLLLKIVMFSQKPLLIPWDKIANLEYKKVPGQVEDWRALAIKFKPEFKLPTKLDTMRSKKGKEEISINLNYCSTQPSVVVSEIIGYWQHFAKVG